jgi:hypothetical protein
LKHFVTFLDPGANNKRLNYYFNRMMTTHKKLVFKSAALALCLAGSLCSSWAEGLNRALVSSSAKWMLHLDAQQFRASKVGAFITQNIVDKKFAEFKSRAELDLDFDFSKISSITAYSSDFQKDSGVLLVRTSANATKDLQSIIAKADKEGKPQEVVKVGDASYLLYNLKGESFLAPDVEGVMIFSKSRPQLEAARDVILRKSDSLAQNQSSLKAEAPAGSYFTAVVEGLSEQAHLPAQAEILKQAKLGAFFVGETGDKTVAQVVLRGKNPEAATQIAQVAQGLIALVSLNQDYNAEARKLAQAASVKNEGEMVNLKVSLASEDIIGGIAKKEGISR